MAAMTAQPSSTPPAPHPTQPSRPAAVPEPRPSAIDTLPPMTVFCRTLGLLTVEGASLGLCIWQLFAGALLLPYLSGNDLFFPEERRVLLAGMAGGGGLFALLALG